MSGILGTISNDVINGFSSLFSTAINAVTNQLNFLNNEFNALIAGAFDFIDSELEPLQNAIDYKARQVIPKVVSDGLKIALGVYALALAMDAIPTLRGATLLNLGVFIQELYGVNQLVASFNSSLINASTGQRLTRYYNDLYRPTDLDLATALDLYYKGNITQDRFTQVLANNGFTDVDIANIIQGSYNPINANLLVRASRIAALDPNYILTTLRKNRLQGDDLTTMFNVIQLDGVRTQLDAFIAAVVTEYSDGQLTDTLFSSYLDYGIIQPNEKTVLMNTGGIKLQITYIKQKITILTTAFEKGFIDQSILKQYLTNLGLPAMTVNNIWLLELIKQGINPAELLQFPTQQFFMPTAITVTTSTALT